MPINIIDHLAPDENKSEFHTSAFAKVATGDRVGSASPKTFSQLRQLDRNRRIIGNYRSSNIGNSYAELRATPIMPDRGAEISVPPRPKL